MVPALLRARRSLRPAIDRAERSLRGSWSRANRAGAEAGRESYAAAIARRRRSGSQPAGQASPPRPGKLDGRRGTRAALAADDTARAARGLWTVLSLDPGYDTAGALLAPLNAAFGDEAAQAKQVMAEARVAAERAKADGLPAFATAVTAGAEGDAFLARRQYAAAAARYLAARDAFDQSRRLAQRD